MTFQRDSRTEIEALDLTAVKFKLMAREGWTVEQLERVETIYKRFLTLVALHPHDVFVPTEEIDEFWHAHILDTRKYSEDMDRCLGYFLHHFPYFGLRGEADREAMDAAFKNTLDRYIQEFGSEEPAFVSFTYSAGAVCGDNREPGSCDRPEGEIDFSVAYERAKMGLAA